MKDELTRIAEALERIANVLTPSVQPPYIEPDIWSDWDPTPEIKVALERPHRLAVAGWLSPTARRGD